MVFALAVTLSVAACHRLRPLDTSPLDSAGLMFGTVQQLRALHITNDEIPEVVKAKQAGFSDEGCVAVVQISRSRSAPFNAGDAVAGLVQVGVADETILELARLNQLGLGVGELQAIRLARLSDAVVLAVARHHAEGKPVPSGASLARLKNAGFTEAQLLNLIARNTTDAQVNQMLAAREQAAAHTGFRRYKHR